MMHIPAHKNVANPPGQISPGQCKCPLSGFCGCGSFCHLNGDIRTMEQRIQDLNEALRLLDEIRGRPFDEDFVVDVKKLLSQE